jgi:hypothetical protein
VWRVRAALRRSLALVYSGAAQGAHGLRRGERPSQPLAW